MTFSIRLEEPVSPSRRSDNSLAVSDPVSLAIEGSQLLQDAGYQFVVSGFGDDRWPTDVAYDLALLIEALPEIISALAVGRPATVEFAGQGIERVVDITPEGSEVSARCRSGTSWSPKPDTERLPLTELVGNLRRLALDYVAAIELVAPALAASESANLLRMAASE